MTMDNIARIIDVGVNQAIRIKNLQAENKRLREELEAVKDAYRRYRRMKGE